MRRSSSGAGVTLKVLKLGAATARTAPDTREEHGLLHRKDKQKRDFLQTHILK